MRLMIELFKLRAALNKVDNEIYRLKKERFPNIAAINDLIHRHNHIVKRMTLK